MTEDINNATAETGNESVVTEANVTEGVEQNQENKTEDKDDGFVEFPKKAKNALSRRDREIAKLRARLREYETRPAETKPAPQTQNLSDAPKEEDFATYGEYIKAVTKHEVLKEIAEKEAARTKAQEKDSEAKNQNAEREKYLAPKMQQITLKSQEYAKNIPDYAEVLQENMEIIGYLPAEIQDAFFEADDTALAFYNLAKEGRLAELAQMSPYRAAMEIAKAQIRPQQTTNAPRPLQGVAGRGNPQSLNNVVKDPEALKKWLNS